jgi:translation initiation factor IF-1
MTGISRRLRGRGAEELSNELCELFGQQFDALQNGQVEVELEQYMERRKRIHQLQTELKMLVARPS